MGKIVIRRVRERERTYGVEVDCSIKKLREFNRIQTLHSLLQRRGANRLQFRCMMTLGGAFRNGRPLFFSLFAAHLNAPFPPLTHFVTDTTTLLFVPSLLRHLSTTTVNGEWREKTAQSESGSSADLRQAETSSLEHGL